MGNIKEAFDNLLNTIASETERKFDELDKKLQEKRIEQLQKDLNTLKARQAMNKE